MGRFFFRNMGFLHTGRGGSAVLQTRTQFPPRVHAEDSREILRPQQFVGTVNTHSHGEIHSTAQKYKVCGVYWMEHGWSILSAHAPLKRVLGGGKGRLQQNSKAAFSCSISKLNFSSKSTFFLADMVSVL